MHCEYENSNSASDEKKKKLAKNSLSFSVTQWPDVQQYHSVGKKAPRGSHMMESIAVKTRGLHLTNQSKPGLCPDDNTMPVSLDSLARIDVFGNLSDSVRARTETPELF